MRRDAIVKMARRAWAIIAICTIAGCGVRGGAPVEAATPATQSALRDFAAAYIRASVRLHRPPKNADELLANSRPSEDARRVFQPSADGPEFAIRWGVDVAALAKRSPEGAVWVYEKIPRSGKRWVLRDRRPFELTDAEFRASPFSPGLESPP